MYLKNITGDPQVWFGVPFADQEQHELAPLNILAYPDRITRIVALLTAGDAEFIYQSVTYSSANNNIAAASSIMRGELTVVAEGGHQLTGIRKINLGGLVLTDNGSGELTVESLMADLETQVMLRNAYREWTLDSYEQYTGVGVYKDSNKDWKYLIVTLTYDDEDQISQYVAEVYNPNVQNELLYTTTVSYTYDDDGSVLSETRTKVPA